MKLTRYRLIVPAMGMFLVLSSQGFGQSPSESPSMKNPRTAMAREEQTVDVSQVPQPARNAAQKALGTTPTEAKVVVGTSPQEYELAATDKSGKAVSVHVLADGKILKKGKELKEKAY